MRRRPGLAREFVCACFTLLRSGCPKRRSRFPLDERSNEAAAYLTFIVNNYHNLPNRMLFIHDNHTLWHPGRYHPVNDLLISSCDADYLSINWTPGTDAEAQRLLFENDHDFHQGLAKLAAPKCEYVFLDCCAQFIVSKEVVRRRAKHLYEQLLKLVLTDDKAACSMEYLWPALFTGECDMHLEGTTDAYHAKHFRCGDMEDEVPSLALNPVTRQKEEIAVSDLHVVVSACKEDVRWLEDSPVPVSVCSKAGCPVSNTTFGYDPSCHEDERGR